MNPLERLLRRLGWLLCGLRRHELLLSWDTSGGEERVFLQCSHCGYETPGFSSREEATR